MRFGRDKTVTAIMAIACGIIILVLFMSGVRWGTLKVRVIELSPTTKQETIKP